jgi:transposase InsO family protein
MHGIKHRLIKPRKPQTNGMVKCFNGRIKEVVQQARFESARQLEKTMTMYLYI